MLEIKHGRFVPDTSAPPFALPAPEIITIDLLPPPSVNRVRKIDWTRNVKHKRWQAQCDKLLLAAKCRSVDPLRNRKIPGQFEAIITLCEHQNLLDCDNAVKAVIDFARRANLIVDDSPRYMRRLVVEWGVAPTGCRLLLREWA